MKLCRTCNNSFKPDKKKTIFCSWECYQEAHKAKIIPCKFCNTLFKVINHRKFCSRSCSNKSYIGRLKSGGARRIDSVGYVTIPSGSSRNRKREHVLIWEAYHKKPVPKGWVVHHKNHTKTDNRISNLEAMPRGEHQRLHKLPKGKCVVCGRPQNARNLCNTHYTAWRRYKVGRNGSLKNKPQLLVQQQ